MNVDPVVSEPIVVEPAVFEPVVVEPVVQFENVSKRFVFTPETPQSVLEMLINFFSRRRRLQRNQDLWAVRDVSFEVLPGEALGIVGRNGSGKSTMLKLIARILRPSTGRIMIHGRTSALLELGAGFHQDLTGHENIFLNASVLGLHKDEIQAKYDDIVAFSELGDYIDMPVKHYSSGMYMRLGFSVAIHVEPDILIVDEILAVGDQAFQTKCIDRIYEMKHSGTTIIMVSHNLSMMRKLCTKLVWLENGRVREAGSTEDVANYYQSFSYDREGTQLSNRTKAQSFIRRGSHEIELTAVRILDDNGQENNTFKTGDKLTVEMDYVAHKPIQDPEFSVVIYHQDGTFVSGTNNIVGGLSTGAVEGTGKIRYCIDQLLLTPARYQITAGIYDSRSDRAFDYHELAYSFRVNPSGPHETFGLVEIPAQWGWTTTD